MEYQGKYYLGCRMRLKIIHKKYSNWFEVLYYNEGTQNWSKFQSLGINNNAIFERNYNAKEFIKWLDETNPIPIEMNNWINGHE